MNEINFEVIGCSRKSHSLSHCDGRAALDDVRNWLAGALSRSQNSIITLMAYGTSAFLALDGAARYSLEALIGRQRAHA